MGESTYMCSASFNSSVCNVPSNLEVGSGANNSSSYKTSLIQNDTQGIRYGGILWNKTGDAKRI
jgi:hypothetical protein